MNFETTQKASHVFFTLLKERIIDEQHECFDLYHESNVRETVLLLADQSKTQIIESPKRIHLVTKASDSLFATNFTHFKEKYKEVENKKTFHLISIILMSFLAQIDHNQASRIRSQNEGITYYALERSISDLMAKWETILIEDEEYGKERKIDMRNSFVTWTNMEVDIESKSVKRATKKTRIGLIAMAMKLLEDEKLLVVLDKDSIPKAFPKTELFERIDYLYHDYERYEEMKQWLEMEELTHA